MVVRTGTFVVLAAALKVAIAQSTATQPPTYVDQPGAPFSGCDPARPDVCMLGGNTMPSTHRCYQPSPSGGTGECWPWPEQKCKDASMQWCEHKVGGGPNGGVSPVTATQPPTYVDQPGAPFSGCDPARPDVCMLGGNTMPSTHRCYSPDPSGGVGKCHPMTEQECLAASMQWCEHKVMRVCCMAMTASCLSCGAGQTVEEYCKANPKTAGCPGVPGFGGPNGGVSPVTATQPPTYVDQPGAPFSGCDPARPDVCMLGGNTMPSTHRCYSPDPSGGVGKCHPMTEQECLAASLQWCEHKVGGGLNGGVASVTATQPPTYVDQPGAPFSGCDPARPDVCMLGGNTMPSTHRCYSPDPSGGVGKCHPMTEQECLAASMQWCEHKVLRVCCMAMTASCLSCKTGQTVEEYCKANPKTAGCPGVPGFGGPNGGVSPVTATQPPTYVDQPGAPFSGCDPARPDVCMLGGNTMPSTHRCYSPDPSGGVGKCHPMTEQECLAASLQWCEHKVPARHGRGLRGSQLPRNSRGL